MSETQNRFSLAQVILIVSLVIVLLVGGYAAWQLLSASDSPNSSRTNVPVPVVETKPQLNDDESDKLLATDNVQNDTTTPSEPESQAPIADEVETPIEPAYQLPNIDESDSVVIAELTIISAHDLLTVMFNDDIIRRIVVFTENFSQGKIAGKHHIFKAPKEPFSVDESDVITISAASFARYNKYVDVVDALEPAQLYAIYRKLGPLFDEVYQEIGRPNREFQQVILEAIEVIEQMPTVDQNAVLLSQSVAYKYAKPEWESLSAAQKQWLRMGERNNRKLLKKLLALKPYFKS